MSSYTTNLGLVLTGESTADVQKLFLTWRNEMAGETGTSNMEKIDAAYGKMNGNQAGVYSAESTYKAGDYRLYEGNLYRALVDIDTAEEFTAAHWWQVTVGGELENINEVMDTIIFLERNRGIDGNQLRKIIDAGQVHMFFDIGDVIYIPWTDGTPATAVTYQFPFVVTHFGTVYDENNVAHEDAMYIEAMYATPQEIAFDAPEAIVATEETFTEGFYYYTKPGDNYEQATVTYGDTIPDGTTYYHHTLSGAGNTLRYGYNRWSKSAYRQWLNSNAAKGTSWWEAQHTCDVEPQKTTTVPGFLNGFTADWLANFKPIKVQTACNTVTDGGVTDTTYDIFFLPSVEQMYGAPQSGVSGIEGEYWEYWKEETGLNSPSNGSSSDTNDARKIPSVASPTGSAVAVRLRSATRGTSGPTWYVSSAGFLSTSTASTAYRAQPACAIY